MNNLNSKHIFLTLILLLSNTSFLFSQENAPGCKVLLKEISGSYMGPCKDGFAHGQGISTGEDSYYGMFKNGLPDGKGVYNYKNGDSFSGTWKKGLRNGKGEYKYFRNGKDSIVSGYWKNGVYTAAGVGDDGYRITNASGIENYTIKRTVDSMNLIEISFEKVNRKYIPRDLEVTFSSGYRPAHNQKVLIADCIYPVTCSLRFTIQTSAGIRQCNLTYIISKKGKWEVFISNN